MSTLLERFCRYVQVETTSNEDTTNYPSTPGQFDLSRMLADELKSLGLADVSMDEFGIVMGTIPGNVDGAPTMCWCSHVDTSPEFSGKNVKPIVHENYDGGDIALPGDATRMIKAADNPELVRLKGSTIITSDGTTLLGADDKAGVAAIVTAADALMKDTSIRHGPIRVLFTCDEEIGRGTEKLDLKKINAHVAYTVDGSDEAIVECETFSADQAIVKITGKNIHPGYAKGKMVNALRAAAKFISEMPQDHRSPETTSDREGFLHPYIIEGGVPEVKIKILLRSFVTAELAELAALLNDCAKKTEADFPGCKVEVDVRTQYRNMAEYLKGEPRAQALAEKAIANVGMKPIVGSIRGGTDGSALSQKGLPTPNLSVGMHNYHSPLEFACLEQMEKAVKVLIELARLWGAERA
ncbi:MAG: peptidase T [Phycisphaerales bacterium]|nr:peptidase T [Phycisphaerales bacterium]MCB9854149.1 peptidase T [Phycisphaerales bacterium]MCB9864715.1 peptidase T [Phycisphaerales bacterium]